MTPIEKAKELCNKFSLEKTQDGYKMFQTIEETKRCALIAVDEILKAVISIADKKYDYWQEVKKEIEKI